MFFPTVTELPRSLEPITLDTFNDGGRSSAARRPSGTDPHALPDDVAELRSVAAGARGEALAAA